MRFIPSNCKIEFEISTFSIPVKAYSDNLIRIKRMGTITGKPSITINVLGFPVFEAIPEIRLSATEKLIEPRKSIKRKRGISASGFPKTIE